MKNSKFIIDKFAKLIEQGLVSSKDITNEILNIFKSKRDEFVFKMKLTSKDEFDVLSKRVENLEKNLKKFETKNCVGACFIINLPDLSGDKKLIEKGIEIHSLMEF